jgi:hypothetical protein
VFAVTVDEVLLDPETLGIQISKNVAKPRMEIHLQNIVSENAKTTLKVYINFIPFFRKEFRRNYGPETEGKGKKLKVVGMKKVKRVMVMIFHLIIPEFEDDDDLQLRIIFYL